MDLVHEVVQSLNTNLVIGQLLARGVGVVLSQELSVFPCTATMETHRIVKCRPKGRLMYQGHHIGQCSTSNTFDMIGHELELFFVLWAVQGTKTNLGPSACSYC